MAAGALMETQVVETIPADVNTPSHGSRIARVDRVAVLVPSRVASCQNEKECVLTVSRLDERAKFAVELEGYLKH